MTYTTLITALVIATGFLATSLVLAGIYQAATRQQEQSLKDEISVFGIFSIRSSSRSLGLVFAGIGLFTLSLLAAHFLKP
jgi:hypothetical protein